MSEPTASPPGTTSRPLPWWQRPRAVMCLLALVYLLSASGRVGNNDVAKMMDVSNAMLEGRLSVPMSIGFTLPGPDGLNYSYFGPLASVWYLPFVGAGQVLAHRFGRFSGPVWEEFMVSFASAPLALAVLGYLVRYWRSRGASPAQVGAGLWMVGIGTSLWPYAKLSGSDLLMALAILAAVVHGLDWQRPREAWWAGVWCGLAWLARKQAEIEVPWVVLFLGLRGWWLAGTRSPFKREVFVPLAWLLAGLLPLVLVQLAYNQARFGSPFSEPNAAVTKLWVMPSLSLGLQILIEMTVGLNRGVAVYNLLAVLMFIFAWPAWRKHATDRGLPLLILVLAVQNLLFFAGTWYWFSGLSYGARYLLFLLPLMAMGWAHVRWPLAPVPRSAFALAGVWAVGIAVLGVLVDPLPPHVRFETVDPGRPLHRTSLPWTYAQECARVLGLDREPLPPALDARSAMHHFAFEVPDLWWCQAAKQFRTMRNRPPFEAPPATEADPSKAPL